MPEKSRKLTKQSLPVFKSRDICRAGSNIQDVGLYKNSQQSVNYVTSILDVWLDFIERFLMNTTHVKGTNDYYSHTDNESNH